MEMKRKLNPEVVEREAKVLELRRGGLTFDTIAKRLGFAYASGAHAAYENACKRIVYAEVEEIRKIEMDRLDIAKSAIWTNVLRGDIPSVTALIRIMDRRAKLLGLDQPMKAQVEVTNYDTNSIDAEVSRLVALLNSGTQSQLDT